MDMLDTIREHAILNRIKHGKASEKSVLGAILAAEPGLRDKVEKVGKAVKEVVGEVNRMSDNEIQKHSPDTTSKTGKQEIALPGNPKDVVIRFAPNPNGPLTLGHARGVVVNNFLAKKYGGKFILRFDDTDPKNKRPLTKAYGWIVEDCKWLGAEPDEIVYASERISEYYKVATELIDRDAAYVCSCTQKEFKKLKDAGKPCPHRETRKGENLKLWQDMLEKKIKPGKAVLRIKTDIKHPDPAMRDWVAFRILTQAHPRVGKKHVVWPMLDFESAVEDRLLGVSHVIRGKDLADSERRQKYVYEYLGWEYPVVLHWGRLKLSDHGKFSTSEMAKKIKNGEVSGWDDPSLPTLTALRRRGITKEAVVNFMLSLGLSTTDISVSLENLYAENRKVLDPKALRYFFVEDPVEVEITCPVPKTVRLCLHPGQPKKGCREVSLKIADDKTTIHIPKMVLKGEGARNELKPIGLPSIRLEDVVGCTLKTTCVKDSTSGKKIEWVQDGTPAALVKPDGITHGLCEQACKKIREGDVIQFERVGFARLDEKKGDGFVFYFGHR